MAGQSNFKQFNAPFIEAVSYIANNAHIPNARIANLLGLPAGMIADIRDGVEPTPMFRLTNFGDTLVNRDLRETIHRLEIEQHRHMLFTRLNIRTVRDFAPVTMFSEDAMALFSDLALNTPLSVAVVAALVNLSPRTLECIALQRGWITDTSRALLAPDLSIVVDYMRDIQDPQLELRLRALERRLMGENRAHHA